MGFQQRTLNLHAKGPLPKEDVNEKRFSQGHLTWRLSKTGIGEVQGDSYVGLVSKKK